METTKLKACDDLICEHLSWVRHIAEKIIPALPPNVETDDLISAGYVGLVKAAKKFSLEKGVKFKTFAEHLVRGAMIDYLRSEDFAPRSIRDSEKKISKAIQQVQNKKGFSATYVDIADEMGLSLEKLHKLLWELNRSKLAYLNDQISDGDDSAEFVESVVASEEWNSLELLERKQICEHMRTLISALSEDEQKLVDLYYFKDLNLKEIGKVFEVTESRVCQIHTQLKAKLLKWYRASLEKRAFLPKKEAHARNFSKEPEVFPQKEHVMNKKANVGEMIKHRKTLPLNIQRAEDALIIHYDNGHGSRIDNSPAGLAVAEFISIQSERDLKALEMRFGHGLSCLQISKALKMSNAWGSLFISKKLSELANALSEVIIPPSEEKVISHEEIVKGILENHFDLLDSYLETLTEAQKIVLNMRYCQSESFNNLINSDPNLCIVMNSQLHDAFNSLCFSLGDPAAVLESIRIKQEQEEKQAQSIRERFVLHFEKFDQNQRTIMAIKYFIGAENVEELLALIPKNLDEAIRSPLEFLDSL